MLGQQPGIHGVPVVKPACSLSSHCIGVRPLSRGIARSPASTARSSILSPTACRQWLSDSMSRRASIRAKTARWSFTASPHPAVRGTHPTSLGGLPVTGTDRTAGGRPAHERPATNARPTNARPTNAWRPAVGAQPLA